MNQKTRDPHADAQWMDVCECSLMRWEHENEDVPKHDFKETHDELLILKAQDRMSDYYAEDAKDDQ